MVFLPRAGTRLTRLTHPPNQILNRTLIRAARLLLSGTATSASQIPVMAMVTETAMVTGVMAAMATEVVMEMAAAVDPAVVIMAVVIMAVVVMALVQAM